MDRNYKIGAWLKVHRLKKQWTLDTVAKNLEFETAENINLYEEGKKPIKCSTFYWLVRLYQVDSKEIFTFLNDLRMRH